jgi:hypothetical protein
MAKKILSTSTFLVRTLKSWWIQELRRNFVRAKNKWSQCTTHSVRCNVPCMFDPFFRRVRKFAKTNLVSSCLSVRPHGTTRLPLDGFSRTLIFENIYIYIFFFFSKIVEKFQVSLKSDKNNGYFYMKTRVHLWYLAELFPEWEMFYTKVEKIKTFYVQ